MAVCQLYYDTWLFSRRLRSYSEALPELTRTAIKSYDDAAGGSPMYTNINEDFQGVLTSAKCCKSEKRWARHWAFGLYKLL